MSTRMTLWHNDEYHLYEEAFDDENVYLEIGSAPFEQLVLKIPLVVWKEMRQHTIQPNERYLDLSDSELLAEAERRVDAHRVQLEQLRLEGGKNLELRMMIGSFLFGQPDSSREAMIESFMGAYDRGHAARPADKS